MSRKEVLYLIPLLLLCHGGYAWVLANFFGEHLEDAKEGKRGRGIFAGLLLAEIIAMEVVSEVWYIPFLMAAAIRHVLLTVLVMLFFGAEAEKKFFGAALAIMVDVLVGNFGDSLLSCLVLLVKKLFFLGEAVYISLWEGYLIGAVAKGAVVLVICLLSKPLAGVFVDKLKRWYVLLAVPLVLIVIVVDVVNFGASIGIMVVSDVNGADYWNEFENEIFSHIAICIVTALSMCAAGAYVFGMNRIYVEQQKKEQYRSLVAFYKMLEEQYGQMERLRHDMKNHLTGLLGLWKNKEWEKMGAYLSQMLEAGNLEQSEEATGSKVVDALLYRKRKQAEAENIRWECDVQIPKECAVDEFDLCVLMGNLVDNALKGAGKVDEGRYVKIRSGVVKKFFLLEVENATVLKGLDEIRISSKEDSSKERFMRHGIGLLNVRETVEKYNGVMNVEVREGEFVVSLLAPLEQIPI